MALITCPDCGHSVSSLAHACPQCARPIAQSEPIAQSQPTQATPLGQPRQRAPRPLLLTIVCIIEFVAVPIGVLFALSNSLPYPIVILAKQGVRFFAVALMWQMRKAGVSIYAFGWGLLALLEFVLCLKFHQNVFDAAVLFLLSLLYPAFVVTVGFCSSSKMT